MHNRASLGLALAIMALSAWGVWSALDWPLKAKLFPLVISIPLFLLAAAEALWVLVGKPMASEHANTEAPDEVAPAVAYRRTASAAAWTIGFFVMIVLLGFLIAVPLLVFLYLWFQGRDSWLFTLAFTAGVWAFFYGVFDLVLHLPFPAGWLVSWLGFA